MGFAHTTTLLAAASPENARVCSHQLPIFARPCRALAEHLRLAWPEAQRLWSDGFLSFDPDVLVVCDEATEAEFVFLASLAAAGLTRDALARVLRDLRRPYAYDLRRLYYDWESGAWRLHVGEDDPEAVVIALVRRLESAGDRARLVAVRELIDDALDFARQRELFLGHAPVSQRPGGDGTAARDA
jgi:hypothetical protein